MVGVLSDLPHCTSYWSYRGDPKTQRPAIWAARRVSHVFNLAEGWSFAKRKVLYLPDGNVY